MADLFNDKIFRNTFFLIILAELLSFLGYYYPIINFLSFLIIVILTMVISLYRLEYGFGILLTELFIGSFGYLFYFAAGDLNISIRIALWLVIMSVWLAKVIMERIKTKKLFIHFYKSNYFIYFAVLSIFIIWGLLNGFLKGQAINNVFFDFNNWLFFLLIFPVFYVFRDKHHLKIIKQTFFAAIVWLSLKTMLLAYFFSHNFPYFTLDLYRWVRQSGVGEITQVREGFSRIFMQSHIFVLIGFFILLFYLLKIIITKKNKRVKAAIKPVKSNRKNLLTAYCLLLTLFLSVIIASFSRSFWLGLAIGGIFVWLTALFKLKIKFKRFIVYNLIILFSLIFSLILILVAIRFPYPSAYGGFNPADLLSQRVTQITNEAGASSRWQLLPPLWQKIKTAPVLGRGFGATVTYKTNDPRILASNPGGLYTTYTFEWGWLDIWLKLGLFGLLAYLILFIKIIKDGLKINSYFSLSLTTGLIVLITVNIFSPYLNHPLGIGYIIMVMAMMENMKNVP
ncbi:MAG: O-antigen ligase family protein [bacterium]|nr:O-antigen ligase family protein [bacterium]